VGEQVTHTALEPSSDFWREVNATRFIVSTLGVLFAISGINHGLFEALQGNAPTTGLFVHSIGPHNQMWAYGTEDAFTLIPNFLATGIAAMVVSLAIVVWSLRFVHRQHGSTVFLLLFVLLLLVGGGVAQVVFFTLAWAVSTRICKPFTWLKAFVPARARTVIGKPWLWLLGGFTALSLFALEIAIAGWVPGLSDPKQILYTCWSLLVAGLMLLLLSIASGLVHDVDREGIAPTWPMPR
jgi:hypothetical protein